MRCITMAVILVAQFMALSAFGVEPEQIAPTFHDCKLLHNFGRIVIVAYCPKDIPSQELASLVQATKGIWLKRYGFVQYRIFSTTKNLPRSSAEMMQKSDAWFEKYEVASALFNSNTGSKDLWCKKTPKEKLSDCSSLVK